jgi:hypothetical protein
MSEIQSGFDWKIDEINVDVLNNFRFSLQEKIIA